MNEQWQELKKTITEMRDNDGTGTQQEVCKFLANLMDVLEKQKQEPKTGHWEMCEDADGIYGVCDICGTDADFSHYGKAYLYCPNCGARMEG